jgi:hypothetical protein
MIHGGVTITPGEVEGYHLALRDRVMNVNITSVIE